MPAELIDLCFRCNYDVRGIPDDRPCPECGLLAGRSRMPTDELRHARPRWLRWLSAGIYLILTAELMVGVSVVMAWILQDRPWNDPIRIFFERWQLPTLAITLACALLFAGVLALTRPEGRPAADNADRGRRRLIRQFAFLPLLGSLIMWGELLRFYGPMWFALAWPRWAGIAAALLLNLSGVPLALLGCYHLRTLARRVLDASLAEHCMIVGWGWAFSVLGFSAMLWWEHESPAWRGGHWRIFVLFAFILASALFHLWTTYLMLVFGYRFARASAAARRAWAESDAATGVDSGSSPATPQGPLNSSA